jgi:hypothetical protein
MTVAELEVRMDAAEFMEWIAFNQIADEEGREKIKAIIAQEMDDEEKNSILRSFLSTL